jgi:hypothetical protein
MSTEVARNAIPIDNPGDHGGRAAAILVIMLGGEAAITGGSFGVRGGNRLVTVREWLGANRHED